MTRAAACEHRNTPVRLTRTTRSHSSSVIASVALTTFTPALLIRTSRRPPPKRAACAIPVSTLMAEPTSRPMAQAWPPVAAMPSATDLAEASSTSATVTRAPALAKASAVARPIPRPAPVTRHVRPVTSKRALATMIGLTIRGDTGPPVKAAAPEYLAIDRRRMEILERARSGGAAMNSTVALLIVMTITFVFTSFAHSAPGEPRLVQGVLEWPARLTAEPFVVVHTEDGRWYYAEIETAKHLASTPLTPGMRVSILGTAASQASVRRRHAFPGLARFTARGGVERHRQDRRRKLGRRAGRGRTDRAGRSLGPQQRGLIAQGRVGDRRIRDAG